MLGGLIFLILWLCAAAISLGLFVLWIWMLVHAIQNKGLSDGERVGWVLAIVFLPFIGSILYFLIGRPKRV